MKWYIVIFIGQAIWPTGWAWGWGSDKVLLRDVSAITLYQGKMTTGRRSSPVPQLKCVGGTAGCHAFQPHTVQCRNVGYDGNDVQWECKADMDDSYTFGEIQVSCEGYDHPKDPYVLKGSCGLEYTIDYTEAGKSRSWNYGSGPIYSSDYHDKSSSGGCLFFLIIIFALVFLICKMSSSDEGSSHHNSGTRFHSSQTSRNNPPSYGFKPEYTQSGANHVPPPSYDDATRTNFRESTTTTNTNNSNAGGFWTGLGLGGLGGYIFGSRRSRGYNYSPGWGYGGNYNNWGCGGWGSNSGGWGSSWGSGNRGWGNSWGSGHTTYRGSSSSSSSGRSRTTSVFGGTSRR